MMCRHNSIPRTACTAVWILSIAAGALAAPVTIVKDGKSQLSILAVNNAQQPLKELQSYLKQMSGADVVIAPAAEGKAGVYVGVAGDFPWLKFDNVEQLGKEGFLLKSDGKSVYLIANDRRGVEMAVWTALQKLGCRWLFPGKVWEDIPQVSTIQVDWNERQVPSFTTQRHIRFGYRPSHPVASEIERWYRQNRLGGGQEISIGHSWIGLDPVKDFAEHPEWFALVNGQRKASKPCYSNPAVIQRAIEHVRQKAKESGGQGMISLTPPDGLGFCECEKCFAAFQGGKPEYNDKFMVWFAKRPDGLLVGAPSETVFTFVNTIAKAVANEYPDLLLGCYAYSGYSHPASFNLEPNVYIQTTTRYRRTPLTLEEQINTWGQKASRVDIRGYYSVYQWDYDGPFPQTMLPATQYQELNFFLQHNVSGVNSEASNNWAPRGLGYYCAAQMHWDAHTDPKGLIQEFYSRAFGPAASAMQRYYEIWYVDPQPEQESYTREMLIAAYQALDEAGQLVKDQPKYRDRVDALRVYAHYLLLRSRVTALEESKDKDASLEAIKNETVFGGRLIKTHMIHTEKFHEPTRYLRRFAKFQDLIAVDAPVKPGEKPSKEPAEFTKAWRVNSDPPTHEEINDLWAQDLKELAIR